MMCAMSKRKRVTVGVAGSAWCVLALAACGGAAKHADSPGTCPEGTVLKGDDCLPESAGGAKSSGDGASPRHGEDADNDAPKGNTKGGVSPGIHTAAASGADDSSSGGGSYDKDAVDAQLKRAAKQVKDNCGSASDEEGAKTGPWGSTTATVVLGRNGHVHEVTVPAPYGGKPVGDCVVNSFRKIQFPPYAGASDVSVTWDVQIVEPKRK
jgi:hypothetical protein